MTATDTRRFLVYRSKKSRDFLCVCAARDGRHALSIARQMFPLDRTAFANPERHNPFTNPELNLR